MKRDLKTEGIIPKYKYKIKYLGPGHTNQRWLVDNHWVNRDEVPERRKYVAALFSTEKPYFRKLFNKMKKSHRKIEFKSFEEFLEHWHQQKAIYGMKCPITGDTMTMTNKNIKNNKGGRTPTNISPDRLLSSKDYTKQNILFVTAEFNMTKGPLKSHRVHHLFNSQIRDNYLKILRERFPNFEYEEE